MKEAILKKNKLPEHYQELEALLRDGKPLNTAELAKRFGVSRRTLQRWLRAISGATTGPFRTRAATRAAAQAIPAVAVRSHKSGQQAGMEHVLSMKATPVTDKEWRALDYLNFLWCRRIARRDELIAMARQRHADISERTRERDMAGLIAEGCIERVGPDSSSACYRLGPQVASNPEFSSEEAARLLGYLELRMRTCPDRSALAGVYAKVARLARLGLGRASFAGLVSDVLTHSRYCIIQGRRPRVDIQETLMLYAVEIAISQRRKLRVVYQWKSPSTVIPEAAAADATIPGAPGPIGGSPQLVDPLGVLYYWILDAWYLVSEMHGGGARTGQGDFLSYNQGATDNLQLWRLDRIRSLSVTDIPYVYPEDFDLRSVFADRWGVQGGEKVHVKVRFYNDFNVISRMQRETVHRRNRKICELLDGSCIFEDDISGLDDFRMWLRGFGASAEVLEPVGLRDAMYQSARKLLERYHIMMYKGLNKGNGLNQRTEHDGVFTGNVAGGTTWQDPIFTGNSP
ncbi:MAG: WYL domain-containing transcriptional regulator [Firmicutes bacterium]|nr:WYL domain-containing transcriptional regulator [Bacillota bacterium]